MASTLLKAVVGLAGATTVGGGATIIYLNSENNKSIEKEDNKEKASSSEIKKAEPEEKLISSLFVNAKIKALTDSSDDAGKWAQKWKEFKGKYEKIKQKEDWKFDNWSDNGPEEQAGIKVLKQKCTANSGKKVVDQNSSLFLEVKAFCTESTQQA